MMLFLIWDPQVTAPDFASTLALHQNKVYLAQKRVLAFHSIFAFCALMAIAVKYRKQKIHLVLPGAVFSFIWMIAELSQQAFTLVALNRYWRPGYLEASTEQTQTLYFTQLEAFMPIWDSFYFVIILAFGLASICYGLALFGTHKFENFLASLCVIIGIFSLLSFIGDYLHVPHISVLANLWYEWFYSWLQPLWRFLFACWLWQQYKTAKSSANDNS